MFLVPHRQAERKFQQEQFIFTNENSDLAWASKGGLGGGHLIAPHWWKLNFII